MLDSVQALLDAFPEGVVQLQDGVVQQANAMARYYLPKLALGGSLSQWAVLPRQAPAGTGVFTVGEEAFSYSCTSRNGEQVILFRPAAQTALTQRQLEGSLRQLRTLLGEILAEVGPAAAAPESGVPAAAFGKSFYRLFRLMDNLEYMQDGAGYKPIVMDLAGLCRQVVQRAYPLLREAGIILEYECAQSSLLIAGDPGLLRNMLLELISNAARAAGEGLVLLTVRRAGQRALITVSDNGPLPDLRQMAAMLQPDTESIPLAGQGAGLGLAVARHIVQLHRGAMMTELGQSTPVVLVSLPAGAQDGRVQVNTPRLQTDGGLDPVLTALSDILPAHLFGLEGLD